MVVLLVEPRSLGPVGRGEAADHVVQGGPEGPLLGVRRRPVVRRDGRPGAVQQFNGGGIVVHGLHWWPWGPLDTIICGAEGKTITAPRHSQEGHRTVLTEECMTGWGGGAPSSQRAEGPFHA